ncbi:LAMI_0H03510g1_1 [Lachancea mirantina]|uniref:LAMI_0H03510g1_1 n=1 Tax=Lachancea mirantina TaxID=1230905 RepID=A0A1G4KE98_9SACH|nr:LAMI_0H03510g1_1 [Lachancea mirantina]
MDSPGNSRDCWPEDHTASVDLLIEEIDKELPSDEKRQIPLQDIGDETMEHIVSYNTQKNALIEEQHPAVLPLKAQCDPRKSVMFSDEHEFHEYSQLSQNSDLQGAEGVELSWDKVGLPESAPPLQKPIAIAENDSASESSLNENVGITEEELKANLITNVETKLSHILGDSSNPIKVPKLREMVNEIDGLVDKLDQEEIKPLSFTIESTDPLNSNKNQHHRMIHYDVGVEQSVDDISLASRNNKHNPSKLPTTNTVSINRLRPTSSEYRFSSGSSLDESETDLVTSTTQDKYRLLMSCKPGDIDQFDNPSSNLPSKLSVIDLATTSNVFSSTNTGDEFHSVNEVNSKGQPERDLSNAIEDLCIPSSLEDKDATFTNLNDCRKSIDGENFSGRPSSRTSSISSGFTSDTESLSENPVTGNEKLSTEYERTKSIDNASIILETTMQQPSNSPKNAKVNSQNSISHHLPVAKSGDAVDGCDCSSLESSIEELNQDSVSTGDHQEVKNKSKEFLPEMPESISLFDEDAPFGKDEDTSADSIDLTATAKPNDYLSIWHYQENRDCYSPTVSHNSQFSGVSTNTAASSITKSTNFKFKPRIVSRSKLYYPHRELPVNSSNEEYDNYTLSQSPVNSVLDPLRRNTLVSRGIQNQIKMHQQLLSNARVTIAQLAFDKKYAGSPKNQDAKQNIEGRLSLDNEIPKENDILQGEHGIFDGHADCHSAHELSGEVDNVNNLKHDGTQIMETNSSGAITGEFVYALSDIESDNDRISFSEQRWTNKGEEKIVVDIWHSGNTLEQDYIASPSKDKLDESVLNQLLKDENEPASDKSPGDTEKVASYPVLKNTDSQVKVCRPLSFCGIEVEKTLSNDEKDFATPKKAKSAQPSPTRSNRVGSPFKVTRARKLPQLESQTSPTIKKALTYTQEGDDTSTPVKEQDYENKDDESLAHSLKVQKTKTQVLIDQGKVYIALKSLKILELDDIKRHHPTIAVEFDNGKNIVQTPWKPLQDNLHDLTDEFELIYENEDVRTNSDVTITLKCKYQSPQSELLSVTEKVPIKKKFAFGKTKYRYENKFVRRKLETDPWDFKFAQDGSFARCKIPLDTAALIKSRYCKQELSLDLMNEWERYPNVSGVSHNAQPPSRKPTYKIGRLTLDICYFPRTSNDERFPKTLRLAHEIIEKYSQQLKINYEGFLWQEGGDVEGMLQRRYFELKGSQLISHHEVTRKPQALINLLRVKEVLGKNELSQDTSKNVRNFTDMVLFSECFKLIFENGEVINFNADSAEDQEIWKTLLQRVISYNKFHQPWVKQSLESKIGDS